MKLELPEEVKKSIDQYAKLDLGDKSVPCPYYINISKERGGLRVMVGKGSPEEITHEVKVWAQLKGFDLRKANAGEIRDFMLEKGIGVDCSGFLVHVINRWMKSTSKGRLIDCIKFPTNSFIARLRRRLRSAENISANTLTGDENNIKIINLNEVKPGDMIRLKGKIKNAHHVLMVTEVDGDKGENGKFKIKKIKYVGSARDYEDENGIRFGDIDITDSEGELKDQKWNDEYRGKNWHYEGLMKEYEDNGIRRLKCLKEEIEKIES